MDQGESGSSTKVEIGGEYLEIMGKVGRCPQASKEAVQIWLDEVARLCGPTREDTIPVLGQDRFIEGGVSIWWDTNDFNVILNIQNGHSLLVRYVDKSLETGGGWQSWRSSGRTLVTERLMLSPKRMEALIHFTISLGFSFDLGRQLVDDGSVAGSCFNILDHFVRKSIKQEEPWR